MVCVYLWRNACIGCCYVLLCIGGVCVWLTGRKKERAIEWESHPSRLLSKTVLPRIGYVVASYCSSLFLWSVISPPDKSPLGFPSHHPLMLTCSFAVLPLYLLLILHIYSPVPLSSVATVFLYHSNSPHTHTDQLFLLYSRLKNLILDCQYTVYPAKTDKGRESVCVCR